MTAICTQAERFVLNDASGSVVLSSTVNDGRHQYGCSVNLSEQCNVLEWEQGDYLKGRSIRVNYHAYEYLNEGVWVEKVAQAGEGIYACANGGSCVNNDTCLCADGWTGYDCNTRKFVSMATILLLLEFMFEVIPI